MYSYYAGESLADIRDNARFQMEDDKDAFEHYLYLKQIPGLNFLITNTNNFYTKFDNIYDDYLEGLLYFDFELIRLILDFEEKYGIYIVSFDREKNLFTFELPISYDEIEYEEDEEDKAKSLERIIESSLKKTL